MVSMSCLQYIGISGLKQVIRKIALQGFHHKDIASCGKQGVVFRGKLWDRFDGFRCHLYFYSECLYYFERVRISQMSIIKDLVKTKSLL